MFEQISQLSSYLENLTGITGILGHISIFVLIMVGHAWANAAPSAHPTGPKETVEEEEEEPDPPRNFTMKQLAHFDGTKDKDGDDKPVYLSLNGIVFDVSDGRNFYGPDGPYELFAGHECGVALAKMSFDTEFLDNLDAVQDLKHGEKMELENWIDKFTHYRCYPVLGRLIPDSQLPSSDRILSKDELAQHTGSEEKSDTYGTAPIYVGAGDQVFDVSFGGVSFYGPGCSYHRFAGKDASRALAKMSFDPEDTENTDVSDLTDKQRKILDDWIKTFAERKSYPVVGRLGKS